ncbi:lipoma-preferred partner isoform X2 [Gouania willdenowi]|uniref:lipoma-preferred partner isoform X2 n=1 Tax=Gouania willdenowi TaxID=441366 RepID=UPI001056C03E|nr:lipoma-preferred partner homolog isoform X2 [Gouania willdenowi]
MGKPLNALTRAGISLRDVTTPNSPTIWTKKATFPLSVVNSVFLTIYWKARLKPSVEGIQQSALNQREKRTMWKPENNKNQPGMLSARMETTPAMGSPSISISQHQAPKKFAPVVAPKPKFNPYKQIVEASHSELADYPPPSPPPEDSTSHPSSAGTFPPPPLHNLYDYQIHGPEKTMEERRSSLDAEIDSLTSILADLESSSPYKPRSAQNFGSSAGSTPNAPVTGYKRMVIPNQPPLTATKKSTPKTQPPGGISSVPPSSASAVAKSQTHPQPVPASYATASTPSQPTFNVQVRSAQPSPQHPGMVVQHFGQQSILSPAQVQYMPAQPKGPDFAYGPPQPGFSPMAQGAYQEQPNPEGTQIGGGGYWKPDPVPTQAGPAIPPKSSGSMVRPEDELERLTKMIMYDMDNPPSDEYFGRCASCGENVVGEGTGCTAMDQVFHVDCFVCLTCSIKLRGKPFYAVEKKAYCEPCYVTTLETCNICSKPIMERILRATGKAYHPHCFTCVMCHRSLDGIPFTVDASNHIHCIEDFHKKFAPRCCVCSEPIMPAPGQEETVRIVALDRDFHVQCYRCEDCGCLLSEGDNQGCYPLDGHVLCKNCNSNRIQALTANATTDL